MPWQMDMEALKDLKLSIQMTCRWPGYAAKVTVIKDMGVLGEEPIDMDGVLVAPRENRTDCREGQDVVRLRST